MGRWPSNKNTKIDQRNTTHNLSSLQYRTKHVINRCHIENYDDRMYFKLRQRVSRLKLRLSPGLWVLNFRLTELPTERYTMQSTIGAWKGLKRLGFIFLKRLQL